MIAIVNYNAGNIRSVQNALIRLGYESIITDDAKELLKADKVIFPGVGEASSAMKYLTDKGLDKVLVSIEKPMLGICLGLQLMCKFSEEGNTNCLGIFDTNVKKFPDTGKVPHIGWNNFETTKSELFKNIEIDNDVYYVHSYYADCNKEYIRKLKINLGHIEAILKKKYPKNLFKPGRQSFCLMLVNASLIRR